MTCAPICKTPKHCTWHGRAELSELRAHATPLAGLWELEPAAVGDARGRFMRLWCEATMQRIAPLARVVQVNQSFSTERGTIRGLHFQRAPAQAAHQFAFQR